MAVIEFPLREEAASGQPGLLAAARRGEDWAWRELITCYQPALLRFLHRHGAEAEDIAFEIWHKLYRSKLPEDLEEEGFRHWLFTAAHWCSVDRFRKLSRSPVEVHEEVEVPLASAEDTVVAASELERILQVVDRLPGKQGEVVRLRFLAGFTASEVAELIGTTESNVYVLSHRALRRLAKEV